MDNMLFNFESPKTEDSSIHRVLYFIKSWKTNLSFFVSSRMLRSFDSNNKNRLRNILKRFLNDGYLGVGVIQYINSHL